MPTTAYKVFNTPDLLGLICSYSTRTSCTRVLRVNKTGFLAAVPVVWNEVEDVINLFKLFPSILITYDSDDRQKITFRPLTLNFSRFDIYAAHVKSVHIVHPERHFSTSTWSTLNAVLDRRPFLPKLQSLTVRAYDPERARVLLYLGWFNWFMTPSLTSIQLHGAANLKPDESMTSLEISAILQTLAEHCPRLERLGLPPHGSSASDVPEDASITLGLLRVKSLEHNLARLHYLRELEGNILLLTSKFVLAVSALPRLRSLKLTRACWESIPASIIFGSNVFPALQSLALLEFDGTQTSQALDLIPVLAQLTCLELVVKLDSHQTTWLVTTLLSRLERMTRLNVLLLDLDRGLTMPSDRDFNLVGPGVTSVFSKLPLEKVRLGCIEFYDSVDLAAMFPSVRRLEFPYSCIRLHMLAPFAAMPKLEYLTIELDLRKGCEPYSGTISCSPNFHTLELSNMLELPSNLELLFQAGQTLLNVWPSMHRVTLSYPSLISREKEAFESLQACISLVRKAKGISTQMAEKYGREEAESMFPADFFSNTISSSV
ncbi:hypothetical protein FRC09_014755 [Ceratobasidium sp. 395]|nr:hypothetical protein FRC09_014755 [Ceratobasidium sp. 395]